MFRADNAFPCYVGKSGKPGRAQKHFMAANRGDHHNRHLASIIRNAGGSLPCIKVRENLSEAEAFDLERSLIASIGREANGGPLVNLTDGGEGISGHIHSQKTREKLRVSHVGQQAWNKGKKHPPDVIEKMRKAKLGTKRDPEAVAKTALANLGRVHSEQSRSNMRAGQMKPESRAKMSAAQTGRRHTLEARLRMSVAAKLREEKKKCQR